MPFEIIRQDITKMQVDAIVNAANQKLLPGGGVCGSIFSAAGKEDMERACRKIGFCPTGEAVITKGFELAAKYVIHAVGPIYREGDEASVSLLYCAYHSALTLARKKRLHSVAFPLISSGIYGFPKKLAFETAKRAITEFPDLDKLLVYLVVYDKESYLIGQTLFQEIKSYIEDCMIQPEGVRPREDFSVYAQSAYMPAMEATKEMSCRAPVVHASPRKLKELLSHVEETFSKMLLRLIDERGLKDAEVYKKANIDRKLFSKIRTDAKYKPKKSTALSLAIALELSLDETKDLLSRAGYALTHSNEADIIVEYFIVQKNYNIYEINEALFSFGQPLLCA